MKKYRLAFVFTQPPFGSARSREGLEALLAASAFCDEDEIFIAFLNDGVFNLLQHQQPALLWQKDYIATFKLISLYELNQCVLCQESISERSLDTAQWILDEVKFASRADIFTSLNEAEKILTF